MGFQKEQDGRSLNGYVVASSVGNMSISDLTEPVQIEIAHLTEQVPFGPDTPDQGSRPQLEFVINLYIDIVLRRDLNPLFEFV